MLLYGVSPPASPASHLAGLLRGGIPPQIQDRQRGVYLWATEEMLCSIFVNSTKGAKW